MVVWVERSCEGGGVYAVMCKDNQSHRNPGIRGDMDLHETPTTKTPDFTAQPFFIIII